MKPSSQLAFVAAVLGLLLPQSLWAEPGAGDALSNFLNQRATQSSKSNTGAKPAADNSTASQDAGDLIMSAMGLIGVSYRFGGTNPNQGFDCSGFMQFIFRQALQVNLPRTSREMATIGTAVAKSDLRPGDLVFFSTGGGGISHVGMYIGDNKFIHAPRTGKNIEIVSLSSKYWGSKYTTARRVPNANRAAALLGK